MKFVGLSVLSVYLFCTIVSFGVMQKYLIPFHFDAENRHRDLAPIEKIGIRLFGTLMCLVPIMHIMLVMLFAFVPVEAIRINSERLSDEYYLEHPEEEQKLNE